MAKISDILDSLREPEVSQFPGFVEAVRELANEHESLLASLKEMLAACEDDCGAVGDLTEFDGDDEAVGAGIDDDGAPDPMALTFGHLRRAARAIAQAEKTA